MATKNTKRHERGKPEAMTSTRTSRFLFVSFRVFRGHCLSLLVLFAAVPPAPAQRDAPVPDPDPELERKALQVADGFEVNLFAADPLLAKPIQINFDAAGRLWVATSEVYPQIKPGQHANDKIVVLEDTKGAGKADKVTVFADGLLIPTGVEPGDGGAYVANSTDLLHLADTDGDGNADRRRVVLSGFGTEDTHHILHTLRWGPEGLLYFNQSVYIHSHVETPYGVRRLGGGGVWQFRPETMRLEVLLRGFWNPWGDAFDRWGQLFVTDGAGNEGPSYGLPGAYYAAAPGAVRLLVGMNMGSPKYCGAEILSGRHLPEEWRGRLVTHDFRAHRVCAFELRPDGAGFSDKLLPDLVKSSHPAFRPVDVKQGPDGAVYIADWYNPIIQHGEVDFRDPRRDHVHGRIWRVTAKDRPPVERPKLVGAATGHLLDSLKAPEDWTRHFAKRVLKERGRSVLPELAAWVSRLDPADPEREHHRLEALWVYQALDTPEPGLLRTLLHADDYRARAAAVRVLGHWQDRVPDAPALLAGRVADDHPQVRMEAVRALGGSGAARAVEVAMRALDRPIDKFLDYALWLTARDLAPLWLPAFQRGELDFGGNTRHLAFALEATGSKEAVRPLVELVRSGKVTGERADGVLTLVAGLGGPAELGLVFDRALGPGGPGRRAALLGVLEQATRQRGVRPAGDLNRLDGLLTVGGDESDRTAAARLAGAWRLELARPGLADTARAEGTPEPLRRAAVEALAELGGPASRSALEELTSDDRTMSVRRLAVAALASLDLRGAARRAAELLSASAAGDDPAELVAAFLQRKGGPAALASAISGRTLPADVAKLAVRAARATGREDPELVAALTRAGGLGTPKRELSPAELRQAAADALAQGDPRRGEAVFRRKELACLKCHAVGGAGGQVGPDLSSLGASAPVDYLIESVLLPNKAIKENYHSLIVGTQKGQVFTGIKVRDTPTELVLRDAEDREVVIPAKDVDEKSPGRSLMPDGLADGLTRPEFLDLVRFLSELGKVGPYAVGPARVVRTWQALEDTPAARAALERGGTGAVGDGGGVIWSSAYSRVAGDLPAEDVPATGVLRFRLEATTGGPARLRLNAAEGLRLWLDGQPLAAAESVPVGLTPGRHTVTVAVDRAARREPLRCELEEVPGSPARAAVVGGK
jgi:putative heme-binding domain-containing protein